MTGELDAITAGDTVVLMAGGYGSRLQKCLVRRATPTQIVLVAPGNGTDWRFRRSDGRAVGYQGYHCPRIAPVTPEVEMAIARDAVLRRLEAINWERLTTETLGAVLAVVDGASK